MYFILSPLTGESVTTEKLTLQLNSKHRVGKGQPDYQIYHFVSLLSSRFESFNNSEMWTQCRGLQLSRETKT